MAGKPWQPDSKAEGHITPTVRQQGQMTASAQLTFSFLLILGSQPKAWCCPCWEWGFSLQLNLSGKARTCLLGDCKSSQTDKTQETECGKLKPDRAHGGNEQEFRHSMEGKIPKGSSDGAQVPRPAHALIRNTSLAGNRALAWHA